MNLYGYAGGDPINNHDPFGLCPDPQDPDCNETIQQAAMRAAEEWFNKAAARVVSIAGAMGIYLRREGPSIIAQEAAMQLIPVVGQLNNGRRVLAVARGTNRFLSMSNHLTDASIGARHAWGAVGLSSDDVVEVIVNSSRWAEHAGPAGALGSINYGGRVVRYSINQNRSNLSEWVLNAWLELP